MCLPSGENATELTEEVCPWKGLSICQQPICASQTRIVSLEHDTMSLPSGENATDLTRVCSMYSLKGFPTLPPSVLKSGCNQMEKPATGLDCNRFGPDRSCQLRRNTPSPVAGCRVSPCHTKLVATRTGCHCKVVYILLNLYRT